MTTNLVFKYIYKNKIIICLFKHLHILTALTLYNQAKVIKKNLNLVVSLEPSRCPYNLKMTKQLNNKLKV